MPINWDVVDDDEILRQYNEVCALYPVLTEGSLGIDVKQLRKILAWVAENDLIKGDDPKLGSYNWSYTAKHVAERAIKMYVHNSELVVAAIMNGYLPDYQSRSYCDFKRGWWYDR